MVKEKNPPWKPKTKMRLFIRLFILSILVQQPIKNLLILSNDDINH